VQAVTTEIENKQRITREVKATQREAKGTPTMCRPPKPMHRATRPCSTPQATQISYIRRQQENCPCIDTDSYAEELEQTNCSVGTNKRKGHIGPEELACFFRNYLHRIQRPFVAAAATMVLVQDVWADRFDLENPDKDVEREIIRGPAPMAKVDDIKKTLEDIENVLNKRRGLGGSPLAYITRETVTLPENTPGEVDPGFGQPSREAELIRRTRHDGPAY